MKYKNNLKINFSTNLGFTLVELSIVLVIIGLLVVGVLAGQTLIRSAEILKVISEKDKYFLAEQTFKLKYQQIPGDMNSATSFWPNDSVYAGFSTQNGNGDGVVFVQGFPFTVVEELRYWQHLSAAGMVAGSYTGTTTAVGMGDPDLTADVNIPKAPGKGSFHIAYSQGVAPIYTFPDRNYFMYAGISINNTPNNTAGILTPEEAYSMDLKIDDGNAKKGKVLGYNDAAFTDCVTTDYNLPIQDKHCYMIFLIDR